MGQAEIAMFAEAVSRNCGAVISLPSAGMMRHHRSRLLAQTEEGLFVEATPADRLLVDQLAAQRGQATITFKAKQGLKVVCTSDVIGARDDFRLNRETIIPAWLLSAPLTIEPQQRRDAYRAPVPEDFGLSARLWRIGPQADLRKQPVAAVEMPVRVIDLSHGGIGLQCVPKAGERISVDAAERLRVLLAFNEEPLLLEGRFRCPLTFDGTPARCGVRFIGLDDDLAGRKLASTIAGIVGQLQRLEARRRKLSA